jgi:acyl carrier protein
MTPDRIQQAVLTVLREVQEMTGRKWSSLPVDAKPIGALDGFDSLAGVEATVMIEEKLGCAIDGDSVFVSQDGKRALTLREIYDWLGKLLAAKGGKQ